MRGRITILTDFGTADGYVAAMKGVLASLRPDAAIDDVAHDLPQGDVRGASWTLSRYWRRYPTGTVHLVVVDPGVGTDRRALAVEADERYLVAPDNGVLTRTLDAAESWRAVEPTAADYLGREQSVTFHGRDVFAPVAGHLASGVELERLGATVVDPVRIEEPDPVRSDESIQGEITAVDRFGNLISNIPGDWLPRDATIRIADRFVPLRHTYGSVEPGELLALINSSRRLEVAVRNGSAARKLDAGEGARLEVSRANSGRASGGRRR